MFTNQYYQLLELLQKKEKGTLNMGHNMRIRRTNCAVMVEGQDRGSSIQKHSSNQHAINVNLSLIL